MSAEDDVRDARRSGRELALRLLETTRASPSMSIRYATVTGVHARACDVDVAGGRLDGLPMTTACAGVKNGDRVIILTQGNLSTIIGVLA